MNAIENLVVKAISSSSSDEHAERAQTLLETIIKNNEVTRKSVKRIVENYLNQSPSSVRTNAAFAVIQYIDDVDNKVPLDRIRKIPRKCCSVCVPSRSGVAPRKSSPAPTTTFSSPSSKASGAEDDLEKFRGALVGEIAELHRGAEELAQHSADLETSNKQLEDASRRLQRECDYWREKYAKEQELRCSLDKQIRGLRESQSFNQIAQLQGRLRQLEDQNAGLSARVSQLQDVESRARIQAETLMRVEQLNQQLEEQLSVLSSRFDTVRRAKEEMEGELGRAREISAELVAANQATSRDHSGLEDHLRQVHVRIASLEEELVKEAQARADGKAREQNLKQHRDRYRDLLISRTLWRARLDLVSDVLAAWKARVARVRRITSSMTRLMDRRGMRAQAVAFQAWRELHSADRLVRAQVLCVELSRKSDARSKAAARVLLTRQERSTVRGCLHAWRMYAWASSEKASRHGSASTRITQRTKRAAFVRWRRAVARKRLLQGRLSSLRSRLNFHSLSTSFRLWRLELALERALDLHHAHQAASDGRNHTLRLKLTILSKVISSILTRSTNTAFNAWRDTTRQLKQARALAEDQGDGKLILSSARVFVAWRSYIAEHKDARQAVEYIVEHLVPYRWYKLGFRMWRRWAADGRHERTELFKTELMQWKHSAEVKQVELQCKLAEQEERLVRNVDEQLASQREQIEAKHQQLVASCQRRIDWLSRKVVLVSIRSSELRLLYPALSSWKDLLRLKSHELLADDLSTTHAQVENLKRRLDEELRARAALSDSNAQLRHELEELKDVTLMSIRSCRMKYLPQSSSTSTLGPT